MDGELDSPPSGRGQEVQVSIHYPEEGGGRGYARWWATRGVFFNFLVCNRIMQ